MYKYSLSVMKNDSPRNLWKLSSHFIHIKEILSTRISAVSSSDLKSKCNFFPHPIKCSLPIRLNQTQIYKHSTSNLASFPNQQNHNDLLFPISKNVNLGFTVFLRYQVTILFWNSGRWQEKKKSWHLDVNPCEVSTARKKKICS